MSYTKRWLEDCSVELGYDGEINEEVMEQASPARCPGAWQRAMDRAPRPNMDVETRPREDRIESLKRVVQWGIENGKVNLIVDLDILAALLNLSKEELAMPRRPDLGAASASARSRPHDNS